MRVAAGLPHTAPRKKWPARTALAGVATAFTLVLASHASAAAWNYYVGGYVAPNFIYAGVIGGDYYTPGYETSDANSAIQTPLGTDTATCVENYIVAGGDWVDFCDNNNNGKGAEWGPAGQYWYVFPECEFGAYNTQGICRWRS